MQTDQLETLETLLDSFDAGRRAAALDVLCTHARNGDIVLPPPNGEVNQHAHTFFSYNAYGCSPSKLAWLFRKAGVELAGIVDFDVLDGLDEFLAACDRTGLKGCGGMETRVFVPEFADKEINSPGEPGVAYHLGLGFTSSVPPKGFEAFSRNLRKTAEQRNRELIAKVNAYLSPVELDYEQDVLPLTPAGNATERHICLAYARQAAARFADPAALAGFWQDKLGVAADGLDLPDGKAVQNAIRAKTMKSGGVGYVRPGAGSFPKMADFNRFILAAGAVPAAAWLNGLTAGEREMERLLDIEMAGGVAMLNIIPDRNFTPGKKDEKLDALYAVVELAQRRGLPVIAGTEMNSPGNRFTDNFASAELRPLLPVFMEGGFILYAHSVLQRACGKGYCSDWAAETFPDVRAKNRFFADAGRSIRPGATLKEIETLLP